MAKRNAADAAGAELAGGKRVPCAPPGVRLRRIGQIDTLADEAFLARIARLSGLILGGGAVLGVLAFGVAPWALGLPAPVEHDVLGVWWLVALGLVSVLALMLHEAVHGALFKLFAPRAARVTFGFKLEKGMLYACAEGIVYRRWQYQVIAAAPAVALTALFIAAGALSGWWLWAYAAAVLHLSGCAGDLAYVADLACSPAVRWCEDTATGVVFYAEEDGGAAAAPAGAKAGADANAPGCSAGSAGGKRGGSGGPAAAAGGCAVGATAAAAGSVGGHANAAGSSRAGVAGDESTGKEGR